MNVTKAKKLSLKEDLFVAAYLANGGNATKAAIAAGYSARTAYAKGSELLKRPNVAAAVQRSKDNITRKFRVNAERVIEEMALIGFSNLRNYQRTTEGDIELAPGVDESAWRAVKKLKWKTRRIPQKDGEPIVEVDTEFELWNKDGELRSLGDYLKLFKENRGGDDEVDDDDLTIEQRNERIIQLLRVAAKRKQQSGGKKRAG